LAAIADIVVKGNGHTGSVLLQKTAKTRIIYGGFALDHGIVVIQYKAFVF
jgi:hypothetical protein